MRIWHQSFTVLEDLPDYRVAIESHIRKVLRPDTEFVMHGMMPGTYPNNYPGTDNLFSPLYAIHCMQWIARARQAEAAGFDAFAMASLPNPMIREIRALVDIPVVGYGEASFHLACMLGQRFGLMLFIEETAPLFREHIETYGLASRCAGVGPVGFTFQDVLPAFRDPAPLIARFETSARALIRAGADVIVPGEMPLNVLLASNGITRVDDVPIVDGLAVTMKMAEMLADLRASIGMKQSRHGYWNTHPSPARVDELMAFYGLDRMGQR